MKSLYSRFTVQIMIVLFSLVVLLSVAMYLVIGYYKNKVELRDMRISNILQQSKKEIADKEIEVKDKIIVLEKNSTDVKIKEYQDEEKNITIDINRTFNSNGWLW